MSISNLTVAFNKSLLENVKKIDLNNIGSELADAIVELIWQRTDAGFDIHGRQWRRYKAKNYEKIKRKYGRGSTEWLNLTGDLRRGLQCKFTKADATASRITFNFEFTVPSDQIKKVEGLISTTGHDRNRRTYPKSDWQFLGLSETGVWRSNEVKAIFDILKKKLQP